MQTLQNLHNRALSNLVILNIFLRTSRLHASHPLRICVYKIPFAEGITPRYRFCFAILIFMILFPASVPYVQAEARFNTAAQPTECTRRRGNRGFETQNFVATFEC